MNREIGSFIELAFASGKEYYGQDKNIARLNSGRAGIYHAARLWNCKTVYLPIYQCETVREFLMRKGVVVKYYSMDKAFTPLIESIEDEACIVLVNYFGIMSTNRMKQLVAKFNKVIVDNSQAFFAEPLDDAYSVYSARKFAGVPDGAYVIGQGAEQFVGEYEQGYSSDTSLFMLQRIEYGCEGKTYQNRTINEERIDEEDIKQMSKLTRTILDSCDYEENRRKRIENFKIADVLFGDINCFDVHKYYDNTCVPMVYPLVVEDDSLFEKLLKGKHFQGHWWNYILSEAEDSSFEYWLSRYMIPITIDQRYGEEDLTYIRGLV